MSIWQNDTADSHQPQKSSMTDVHFKIECTSLPVDHAYALSSAVHSHVPWLAELANAGVQPVHVAASQNGWERPDVRANEDLILSRRTRLKIRVDVERADTLITALCGQRLAVGEHEVSILSGQTRDIIAFNTLFSRYTYFEHLGKSSTDEELFEQAVIIWCNQHGFQPLKLLCGKGHVIASAQGDVFTRSVLLADVATEHSLMLQDRGIGDLRSQGCGIVVPHKDTGSVQPT